MYHSRRRRTPLVAKEKVFIGTPSLSCWTFAVGWKDVKVPPVPKLPPLLRTFSWQFAGGSRGALIAFDKPLFYDWPTFRAHIFRCRMDLFLFVCLCVCARAPRVFGCLMALLLYLASMCVFANLFFPLPSGWDIWRPASAANQSDSFPYKTFVYHQYDSFVYQWVLRSPLLARICLACAYHFSLFRCPIFIPNF